MVAPSPEQLIHNYRIICDVTFTFTFWKSWGIQDEHLDNINGLHGNLNNIFRGQYLKILTSFFFFFFTDPYQTLGPISSRLANPGKKLNYHETNRQRWHKWGLYTVCFGKTREKTEQPRAGALNFPKWSTMISNTCCVRRLASHLCRAEIRLPSHQNDCLPCCFLTEGQALSSSKNRTGKQSPYKLPDPSAHRPVGRSLPHFLTLPPSHTVKRSHLVKKKKCYRYLSGWVRLFFSPFPKILMLILVFMAW